MLEGEYLDLCNQLKEKFDKSEGIEKDLKSQVLKLKNTVLFYSSMVQALSIEMNSLGLEYMGNCSALIDILATRSSIEIENMIQVNLLHGFNVVNEESDEESEEG